MALLTHFMKWKKKIYSDAPQRKTPLPSHPIRTKGQIYTQEICSTKDGLIRVYWCGRSLPEINILFTKATAH